jgi:hypothetical protein
MRYLSIFYCALHLLSFKVVAQNLSGQWKGSFNEARDDESTEYILELDVKGKKVEGTSITYFSLRGKKYFTMCAIEGSYDPSSKTIVSKEVSKVKANTPSWFRDCFQTHTLTFFKKGEEEQLSGTWKSTKKEDNCGRGTTLLKRKVLAKKSSASKNQDIAKEEKKPTIPAKESEANKDSVQKIADPKSLSITPANTSETEAELPLPKLPEKITKRSNKIFETIEVKEEEVYVSIFDNAEIDGDVITVIFNGAIVLANQTLSDQPISFRLQLKKGIENLLTMYAENQGKTPPNTAIMRIQHGDNYQKVLLSADEKQNASVIFKVISK